MRPSLLLLVLSAWFLRADFACSQTQFSDKKSKPIVTFRVFPRIESDSHFSRLTTDHKFAIYSDENSIRFWNLESGKMVREIVLPEKFLAPVVVSDQGTDLAYRDPEANSFTIKNSESSKITQHLKINGISFSSHYCFSSDARHLAAIDDTPRESKLRIWDLKTGKNRTVFSVEDLDECKNIRFADGDSKLIIIPNRTSDLIILDLKKDHVSEIIQNVSEAVLSPAGDTLAYLTANRSVNVINIRDSKVLSNWALPDKQGEPTSRELLGISKSGNWIAWNSHNGTQLRNCSTGKVNKIADKPVTALEFSEDGKSLTYHQNGISRLDLDTLKTQPLLTWKNNIASTIKFGWSGDGSRILATDKTEVDAHYYSTSTGKLITTQRLNKNLWLQFPTLSFPRSEVVPQYELNFRKHFEELTAFESYDQRFSCILVKGYDAIKPPTKSLKLIEKYTGDPILEMNETRPLAISFSLNSRRFALLLQDEIRIFDTATGAIVETIEIPKCLTKEIAPFSEYRIALSPNGDRIAMSDKEGTIAIYQISTSTIKSKEKPIPLEQLWKDLASTDPKIATAAYLGMTSRSDIAIPFLLQKIQTIESIDHKILEKILKDLDSANFRVREKAFKDAQLYGELLTPYFEGFFARQLSAEQISKLEVLKEKCDKSELSVEHLRLLRAMAVLEFAEHPKCRQKIDQMAGGLKGIRVTEEAKAIQTRMDALKGIAPKD